MAVGLKDASGQLLIIPSVKFPYEPYASSRARKSFVDFIIVLRLQFFGNLHPAPTSIFRLRFFGKLFRMGFGFSRNRRLITYGSLPVNFDSWIFRKAV